jgi:hypothetical protein
MLLSFQFRGTYFHTRLTPKKVHATYAKKKCPRLTPKKSMLFSALALCFPLQFSPRQPSRRSDALQHQNSGTEGAWDHGIGDSRQIPCSCTTRVSSEGVWLAEIRLGGHFVRPSLGAPVAPRPPSPPCRCCCCCCCMHVACLTCMGVGACAAAVCRGSGPTWVRLQSPLHG